MKKSIGVIGSGNIGQAVTKHLLKAGFLVVLSNRHGAESLKELVKSLANDAKAGSVQDAAKADIILLAVPWIAVPSLKDAADWTNKIVIDATNHFVTPDMQVADLGSRASSEEVQDYLPGARIVKAFNTLAAPVLAGDPQQASGSRVLFISGDDKEAKAEVSEMIKDIGFAPIDIGSLSIGGKLQQPKGALSLLNIIKL